MHRSSLKTAHERFKTHLTKKLLWCLVVRRGMLLYHLRDSSRLNTQNVGGVGVVYWYTLSSVQTSPLILLILSRSVPMMFWDILITCYSSLCTSHSSLWCFSSKCVIMLLSFIGDARLFTDFDTFIWNEKIHIFKREIVADSWVLTSMNSLVPTYVEWVPATGTVCAGFADMWLQQGVVRVSHTVVRLCFVVKSLIRRRFVAWQDSPGM